jgi:hypothetical protein
MFYACFKYGDSMVITSHQRDNLKKFTRSLTYSQGKDLGFPAIYLTRALTTKDEKFFFGIYDNLVARGWIKDQSRSLELPNGIDDEFEDSIVPKPKPVQPKSKPNLVPSVLPSTRKAKPALLQSPQVINTPPVESKKPKVRYNLLIDEDLLERLKVESLEVDRSVSSLIRISIISYLDKKRP